jgi:hypothetical protein
MRLRMRLPLFFVALLALSSRAQANSADAGTKVPQVPYGMGLGGALLDSAIPTRSDQEWKAEDDVVAIKRNRRSVAWCFFKEKRPKGDRARITLTIRPNGTVSKATVTHEIEAMRQCLEPRLRKWRLGKFRSTWRQIVADFLYEGSDATLPFDNANGHFESVVSERISKP